MILEIEVHKTVEVTVGIDEIIAQIENDRGPDDYNVRQWIAFVSRHAGVWMQLPDQMIAQMTEVQRKIVADELAKQAERFREGGAK